MVPFEVLETECAMEVLSTELYSQCSGVPDVQVSWYLELVELTKLPGTSISSALVLEMPSMSRPPAAWWGRGNDMACLFIYLFVTLLIKVSLLQKAQELYLVEEQGQGQGQGQAGRPQVDMETLLRWLSQQAWDPAQNLEGFDFVFLNSVT